MSEVPSQVVAVDPDGQKVSLELAATFASVGAWWVHRQKANTDDWEKIGEGETESTVEFEVEAPVDELIGDRFYAIVVVSSLQDGKRRVGAETTLRQGDEVVETLDSGDRVEGSKRFDFEFVLKGTS